MLEHIASAYDTTNPNQKEVAFGEMKAYLSALSPIVKDAYVPVAATILGVSAALFGAGRDDSGVRRQFAQSEEKEDPEWQSILKTLVENDTLVNDVIDVLSDDMLGGYAEVLHAIIENRTEHPRLMRLSIDTRIPTLTQEELRRALLKQLEIYYLRKLKQAMADRTVSFEKKVYIRNKIQKDIIPKLKRGELIPYEGNFIP